MSEEDTDRRMRLIGDLMALEDAGYILNGKGSLSVSSGYDADSMEADEPCVVTLDGANAYESWLAERTRATPPEAESRESEG